MNSPEVQLAYPATQRISMNSPEVQLAYPATQRISISTPEVQLAYPATQRVSINPPEVQPAYFAAQLMTSRKVQPMNRWTALLLVRVLLRADSTADETFHTGRNFREHVDIIMKTKRSLHFRPEYMDGNLENV